MFQEAINSFDKFYPELALSITILVIILVELFFKRKTHVSGIISIIGLAVTFLLVVQQMYFQPQAVFYQMIVLDPFAYFFKLLLILSGLLIVVFSFLSRELAEIDYKLQEYYTLILSLTLGGFLMASSVNLLMMYLSLELVSISSYILSGYFKKSKRSNEAALKYVIYGGVSSGIMLYGISILYGICGTTDIFAISNFIASNPINLITLLISVFLILAGFGYKISAVPFHFWAPDVYEGAPLPVTALLSVSSKAAGFAMMIRFFLISFRSEQASTYAPDFAHAFNWTEIIAVISVATMTLGNFVAIWQDNIKRLLAYSSIAQAGYILLGLTAVNNPSSGGLPAMVIYFSVYLFMNLGAFLCAIMISNKFKTESIEEMKGFGYRAPFLCVSFGIFLFSLTGIPLTAGFIGKFYIFSALIKSGYIWLAVIGLLNSVVSLYYYVKILKNMFLLRPTGSEEALKFGAGDTIILLILIVPTIFFGIYFTPLTKFAEYSVQMFGMR
jgi:NADH-quinone oxidoreductase subunit N